MKRTNYFDSPESCGLSVPSFIIAFQICRRLLKLGVLLLSLRGVVYSFQVFIKNLSEEKSWKFFPAPGNLSNFYFPIKDCYE